MSRQMVPKRRRRRTRLETHYICRRICEKDSEGNTIVSYEQNSVRVEDNLVTRSGKDLKSRHGDQYTVYDYVPRAVQCEVWPAGGEVQTKQYGDRVNNIYNVHIDEAYTIEVVNGVVQYVFEDGIAIREHDGFCYFAGENEDPDCRIISIKPYAPLFLEVERI